jgi:tryptophanyl-tRNA synthetase
MHLGNLAGALRNWVRLQADYECFYSIVDWHALMSEFEHSEVIGRYTWEVLADWLAVGLDPKRATIFIQSHVPQHAELHLVLSSITPIPWLERCPTYKEQLQEMRDHDLTNYAFLGYPVLMAADILLYRADTVPVGDDQLPHLELAREIGRRFNYLYGDVFPEPQAILAESSRILGLDRRKMSKSYGNFIALADEPGVIREKVMSMVTDPQRIRRSDPGRPDYCNVHSYFEAFGDPEEAHQVARRCHAAEWGCTECKARLAEVLVELLAPIRERREQLLRERSELEGVVEAGSHRAREEAAKTMDLVHRALGF